MFAYCNNAPVLFVDDSGTAPWPTTVAMSDASGSSRKGYTDKDQAAIAFARKNYSRSRSERTEYGAIIYSKTIEGVTRYTCGKTLEGTSESIETNFDVDNYLLASGWSVTGFIHTHPNYSSFSRDDLDAHSFDVMIYPTFSTYVVFGPNANSYIIRKLQGIGNYLVYPILDRGSSWISSTRVNEKR